MTNYCQHELMLTCVTARWSTKRFQVRWHEWNFYARSNNVSSISVCRKKPHERGRRRHLHKFAAKQRDDALRKFAQLVAEDAYVSDPQQ